MLLEVMVDLNNGVEGERPVIFAQDEHTQAASLRVRLENNRGKLFIVCSVVESYVSSSNEMIPLECW